MDVFRMLPGGTLSELLNDVVYISPSSHRTQQEIPIELSAKIWMHVKKSKAGKSYEAPMDVFLDNRNAVQPDILVILSDNLIMKTDDGKIKGIPDFIIEIVSSATRNMTQKKRKTSMKNSA